MPWTCRWEDVVSHSVELICVDTFWSEAEHVIGVAALTHVERAVVPRPQAARPVRTPPAAGTSDTVLPCDECVLERAKRDGRGDRIALTAVSRVANVGGVL